MILLPKQISRPQVLLFALGLTLVILGLFYFFSGDTSRDFENGNARDAESTLDVAGENGTEAVDQVDSPSSPELEKPTQEQQAGEGESASSIDESNESSEDSIRSETGVNEPEQIESKRRSVDIVVAGSTDAIAKTKDLLFDQGEIGPNDSLEELGSDRPLGGASVIKLQQTHRGIPVYGAETILTLEDEKLKTIHGKTASDIDMDVVPSLTAEEAFQKASEQLGEDFSLFDQGKLVIYKTPNDYVLSWYGNVEMHNGLYETMIVNSHNAEILLRFSAVHDEN